MRSIIISSEAVPFAKTGGLGDVAGALPRALRESANVDATLIIPLYDSSSWQLASTDARLVIDDLQVEWYAEDARVGRVFLTESLGAPIFLIDAPRYFRRSGFYGYTDDHERFAYFSRAAIALIKRLGTPPDIVHLNDWFGGFAATELKARRYSDAFFNRTRTVFSIHNLAYQGKFDLNDLGRFGFYADDQLNAFRHDGAASAMKAGLTMSDALSTVSRRYAFEIQMSENGYGLDWLLRERSRDLYGITNGIDSDVWNPAKDRYIAANYDLDSLDDKRECKRDLLRAFNLPEDLERPLIGSISRLTAQKGFDLIKQAAGAILETGAMFVSLGSGASEYENFLQALRDAAPHRVGVFRGYNELLAHKIEAGADLFLMPSLFEPCGLNQMYSQAYGTIPIVRATGGLDDTVQHFNRLTTSGNGFKFESYTADAMLEAVYEALMTYADKDVWRTLQTNAMRIDNSWHKAAREYAALYQRIASV